MAQGRHRQPCDYCAAACSPAYSFIRNIPDGQFSGSCLSPFGRIWSPVDTFQQYQQSHKWNFVYLDYGEELNLSLPLPGSIDGHDLSHRNTQHAEHSAVPGSPCRCIHHGVQDGHGPSTRVKPLTFFFFDGLERNQLVDAHAAK